tara:strand:- start:759 stop:980 length:222 start_codon:yes stop_codon:yes gene_type:complete
MPEWVDPSMFHNLFEDLVIESRDPTSDVSELLFNKKTGNWEFQLTYDTVLRIAGEKVIKETEEFLEGFPERLA